MKKTLKAFAMIVSIGTAGSVFAQNEIKQKYWNTNPVLTKEFNKLLEKVPKKLESLILHQHYEWKNKYCKKTCSGEELEKRIKFYKTQPVDHGQFQTVIFRDHVVVPYPKKAFDAQVNARKGEVPPWGLSGSLVLEWDAIFRSDDIFYLRKGLNEVILDLRDKYYQPKYNEDRYLHIRIITSLDQFVTIEIYNWEYEHGAAHGVPYSTRRHYHANTAREVSFPEFFIKDSYPEFQKFIIKLADANFSKEYPGIDTSEKFNRTIVNTLQKFERWHFDEEGANLLFQVYEVAPYSAGFQELKIGWKEIRQFLTPFGKSIFEEFQKRNKKE